MVLCVFKPPSRRKPNPRRYVGDAGERSGATSGDEVQFGNVVGDMPARSEQTLDSTSVVVLDVVVVTPKERTVMAARKIDIAPRQNVNSSRVRTLFQTTAPPSNRGDLY